MSDMTAEMVCGACGARSVAGEDFCGECGTYLEWEGVPAAVDEPVLDQSDEATRTEETPKTVVERVKAAVGLTDETAEEEVRAREPASTPETDAAAAPAAEPEQHVAAVLPGRAAPKPRRRPVVIGEQPIQPGDLICGHCGAGNKPARKFCRRCGKDLVEAEMASIPWWRHLFARRRGPGRKAGSRPKVKGHRRWRSLSTKLVALVVFSGLLFVTWPWMTKGYEAVLDRIRFEPVKPDSFNASSSEPGHGPGKIRDGEPSDYWAPSATREPEGEWVEVRFDPPVRLVRVLVRLGVSDKDATFQNGGWPTRLRATMFTAAGDRIRKILDFSDTAEPQERALTAGNNVTRVRFHILDFEKAKSNSPVAIGEIEFFRRR